MTTENAQPIRVGFTPTTNTKLATALVTMGVQPHKTLPQVSNVYDDERPFRRGQPGHVTYFLEGKSDHGIQTGALIQAWEERGADLALDQAFEQLDAAIATGSIGKIHAARDAVRKLFPFALVAYFRGYAENRERLSAAWKDAEPYLRFPRGGNACALISKRNYDRMSPAQKNEFTTR